MEAGQRTRLTRLRRDTLQRIADGCVIDIFKTFLEVRLMRFRFSLSMLATILACALLPQIGAADSVDLQGKYVIDEAASEDIDAAIEKATADFNFAMRSMARSRISATNPRYKRIGLAHNDKVITVQFDEANPLEMPADGRAVPWTREDGLKFNMSGQWNATQLVMTLASENKMLDRVNTFTLAPDGKVLKLQVRLTGARLSQPLEYLLVYRREAK
jgi:hypothetical protein